jgi:hypothetical protein
MLHSNTTKNAPFYVLRVEVERAMPSSANPHTSMEIQHNRVTCALALLARSTCWWVSTWLRWPMAADAVTSCSVP